MQYTFDESTEINPKSLQKLENTLSKGTTVLLNYAKWCGHCKMFEPTWAELKEEFAKNKIKTVEIEHSALEKLQQHKKIFKRITNNNQVYFPMIIFYVQKGDKCIKKIYEGDRSKDMVKEAILSMKKKSQGKKSLKKQRGGSKETKETTDTKSNVEKEINAILDKFFKL